jgi:E3 ubiquitin-protein ligase synoviolin
VALPEAAQNGVVDEDHRTEKGKGKERDISPLDEEAKYIPYLAASAPLRAGLGDRPGSWTSTPSDADGTRTALVERIRLLRDVDESVWRLVGELSRVKSAWEVEDGITRSGGEGEGDEVTAGAVG